MAYYVRLMRKEDVPQVNEIDHEAFENWWPLTNYEHELENNLAHYIVACDDSEIPAEPPGTPSSENGLYRFASRVKQIFSHNSTEETLPPERVVGFAGFWIMAEEAHIISIAVREVCRHHGIGELMLMRVIEMAMEIGARFVTLEARVSNITAQNLYRKYGFTQMGIRRGYYTDNREDAVIMSTGSIASTPYQSMLKRLKRLYTGRWGIEFPETADKT